MRLRETARVPIMIPLSLIFSLRCIGIPSIFPTCNVLIQLLNRASTRTRVVTPPFGGCSAQKLTWGMRKATSQNPREVDATWKMSLTRSRAKTLWSTQSGSSRCFEFGSVSSARGATGGGPTKAQQRSRRKRRAFFEFPRPRKVQGLNTKPMNSTLSGKFTCSLTL